jgi:hypothetical protein
MKYLDTEEKRQRRLVHIPMGRFGLPQEIAKAALFLASDDVSIIIIPIILKLIYWLDLPELLFAVFICDWF